MENQTNGTQSGLADSCEECSEPETVDVMRFQRAIRAITGKWKIEIMCSLIMGPLRFGQLRRALPGITQHMLTEQLRALAADGIVIRIQFPEIPPRVEYELTRAGKDLIPLFAMIRDWALRYEAELGFAQDGEG
ncbi:winged helix-turn-helix transcriptional regulator [Alteraurantiacibacter aquimixticola]|nr:helix-turn-helix domain-containing protein [Alteraurantiacibacter aquimixticola]